MKWWPSGACTLGERAMELGTSLAVCLRLRNRRIDNPRHGGKSVSKRSKLEVTPQGIFMTRKCASCGILFLLSVALLGSQADTDTTNVGSEKIQNR